MTQRQATAEFGRMVPGFSRNETSLEPVRAGDRLPAWDLATFLKGDCLSFCFDPGTTTRYGGHCSGTFYAEEDVFRVTRLTIFRWDSALSFDGMEMRRKDHRGQLHVIGRR